MKNKEKVIGKAVDVGGGVRHRRVNAYNVFQRSLSSYFKDEKVDWRSVTGLSLFSKVAASVWKDIPAEGRSDIRGIEFAIEGYFNDVYGSSAVSPVNRNGALLKSERLEDLKKIDAQFGEMRWWEFHDTMTNLLTSSMFIEGDSVVYDGSGIMNSYSGVTTVFGGTAIDDIYAFLKKSFNKAKHGKPSGYSSVSISLELEETLRLSSGNSLLLVYKLQLDTNTYISLTGNEPLTDITQYIDVTEGGGEEGGDNKRKKQIEEAIITPVVATDTRKEADILRELELEVEKQWLDIQKLEKEIEKDLKKEEIKAKKDIKLAEIRSSERVKKAKIKEYKSMLKAKDINFAQYRKLMKDL